jgi:hypothetical protein
MAIEREATPEWFNRQFESIDSGRVYEGKHTITRSDLLIGLGGLNPKRVETTEENLIVSDDSLNPQESDTQSF